MTTTTSRPVACLPGLAGSPGVVLAEPGLTSAQGRCLVAVLLLTRAGRPPSMRALAAALGCRLNTVAGHLDRLERDGWLTREARRARTLTVVDPGRLKWRETT